MSSLQSSHRSPLELVSRGLLVALVAALLTLFLPGWVAKRDGVFYEEDVRAKLPSGPSHVLADFDAQKKSLSDGIRTNLRDLATINNPSQQKELEFEKDIYHERSEVLKTLQPPLFPQGFLLSGTMLLWPSLYTCLGCLLFCFRIPNKTFSSIKHVLAYIGCGLLIYTYYEWPLWVRNGVLGLHNRTVFYFTNVDIDIRSFFMQEAIIAGLSFLIAAVWFKWNAVADTIDLDHETELAKGEYYLNYSFVSRLQKYFYEWIVGSFILAAGFLYFTSFYWNLVVIYHDARYLLSAILAHSLWILTWVFLSMPLAKSWICLKRRRLHALDRMIQANFSNPPKGEQLNFETLDKLESIAGVKLQVAGAGALLSLCLPLLQLLIRR